MLGTIAGILFAPIVFLETTIMIPFLIKSFCAAIMGGLASVTGTLVGGVILGVTESITGIYIYPEGRDAVAIIALVLILLIKPAGLFGVVRRKRV
jgi:branched-chain amino acid transport system permease protein